MNAPRRTDRAVLRARRVLLLPACLLALLTGGCRLFRPGPPPPPLAMPQVIEAVRAQSAGFRTVKDGDISLSVTVTDAEGKPDKQPSLGGALAFDAARPALWLYTAKMTRSVFSLTAVGSRFWFLWYPAARVGTGTDAAYDKLPELIRPDEVRSYFAGPEMLGISWPDVEMVVEPDDYRFDVRVLGVLKRQVYVDRRKVVLSGIRSYNALGELQTDLHLDRYKQAGDGLLFHRLRLDRPPFGVMIELRLGDPRLNEPLHERTFEPSLPGGWPVIDLDQPGTSAAQLFQED